MMMIPLPYVLALVAMLVFAREWVMPSPRHFWLLWFLAMLTFQEVLVGTRFGYGVEPLKLIQPVTAATLPPLAYLGFARPKLSLAVTAHAIPVLVVVVLGVVLVDAIDAALALNNLFYAAALVLMGLRGSDALAWAEFGQTRIAMAMLWLVAAVLIISGLVDGLISYDFLLTSGSNVGRIIAGASLIGLLIGGLLLVWGLRKARAHPGKPVDPAQARSVFDRLQTLMQEERLFLDPDINLLRIARRLSLPVREVSQAINQQTNQNVSQYVNSLRINEVCRLLTDSDKSITETIYASGYNSKSNFNREFLRIMGQTPTRWRQMAKAPQTGTPHSGS